MLLYYIVLLSFSVNYYVTNGSIITLKRNKFYTNYYCCVIFSGL